MSDFLTLATIDPGYNKMGAIAMQKTYSRRFIEYISMYLIEHADITGGGGTAEIVVSEPNKLFELIDDFHNMRIVYYTLSKCINAIRFAYRIARSVSYL
jgi:hypothetical protein